MEIQCSNIQIIRGHREIISSLSFQHKGAKLIGLLGPNGAGKTTLIRAIAGLQNISQGELTINDLQPQQSPSKLAHIMAYLPQQRTVHWALNNNEIVMLGRLPHQQTFQRPSDEDHKIVQDIMKTMNIDALAHRPFEEISGGEQARVLIARALAQQPEILLADEPTNGLDPAHQIRMMETFQQVVSDGCTVLLSIHDINLAAQYCDRILLMQEGHLVHDGAVKEVFTQENLSQVYGIETEIRHSAERLSVNIVGIPAMVSA
ncbi:MAG: ABC transporter ATP-binding protein [Thiotrichaceae bacterium]|nr:ABC transporter ATP-binding protein [Thiotrichaceae bacterium]